MQTNTAHALSFVAACTALTLLFACGTSSGGACDDGEFCEETTSSSGGGIGTSSGGGLGGSSSGDGSVATSSSGGPFEECAAAEQAGEPLPLHLVLALDTSGSFCHFPDSQLECDGFGCWYTEDCSRDDTTWQSVKPALNSFFAAQESRNIYLSIVPWGGQQCRDDLPVLPGAAEVRLPDGAPTLAAALEGITPQYRTPTAGGIASARNYAASLTVPEGEKAAMLLVTDGLPTLCGSDPMSAAISATNAAKEAGYPPFVLGIRDWPEEQNSLQGLHGIAQAAETNGGAPIIIQPESPTQVTEDLLEALNTIREQVLGCDIALPQAPEGETLDYGKVNVVHVSAAGQETPLDYSADCSNPNGWKYDNPAAPTRIEFCPSSCSTVKSGGTVKIVLGCETRGGIVN